MSELGEEWGQLNVNRTFDLNEETLGTNYQMMEKDILPKQMNKIKIESSVVPNSSN